MGSPYGLRRPSTYGMLPDMPRRQTFGASSFDLPDMPEMPAGYGQQEPTTLDWILGTGLRVVPSIVGGLGGAALGNVPGGIAGGAVGSGIGELLGQSYEKARGIGDYSLGRVASETALGGVLSAVPGGKTIPRALAWGAGQGAAAPYLRATFEGQDWADVNPLEAAVGAGVGGALGGGIKFGLNKLQSAYRKGADEALLDMPAPRLTPDQQPPLGEAEIGPLQPRPTGTIDLPDMPPGPASDLSEFMRGLREDDLARRRPVGRGQEADALEMPLGELPADRLAAPPRAPIRAVEPLPLMEATPQRGPEFTESGDIPWVQPPQPTSEGYWAVDARQMQHKPEVYQIKQFTGKGSTGKLEGVEEWFKEAGEASPIVLHETADGSLNVVDGHQRTLLAQRLMAQGREVPALPSIILRESEGWTIPATRRLGAMLNITGGTIDPIDIARVLRTGKLTAVEQKFIGRMGGEAGEAFRAGEELANLSEPIFQRMMRGEVSPVIARGAARFATPEQQLAALTVLNRSEARLPEEVDALARRIQQAGFKEERTQDLFGEVFKLDPLVEVAGELENAVARELSRGRSAFANLVRNETRIGDVVEGVNVQAAKGESLAQARMRSLLRKVSDSPNSATSRAINEAAAAVSAGTLDKNSAMRNIMAAIESDWQTTFGKGVRGESVDPTTGRTVGSSGGQPVAPSVAGQPAVGAEVQPGAELPRPSAPGAGAGASAASGQAGGISVEPLTTLAGGAAGATYGYATGETPEERTQRAAGFGVAGALGGLGLAAGAARMGQRAVKAPAGPLPASGKPFLRPDPTRPAIPALERPGGQAAAEALAGQRRAFSVSPAAQKPIPDVLPIPEHRLQNVNLGKLDIGDASKQEIADIMAKNQYFESARRGRQSHAATLEQAKRLEVEIDRVMPKGTVLPAPTRTAVATTLVNLNERVQALRKVVADARAGGSEDYVSMFELAKVAKERDVVLQMLSQNAAETGRALEAHKMLARLLPGEIRVLLDAKKNVNIRRNLEAFERELAKIQTDDAVATFGAAFKSQKLTKGQAVTNYYLTNLLSGIQTQERNFLGTLTNMVAKNVMFPLTAVPIDIVRSLATGKPREILAGELRERWTGLMYGMNKAFNDASYVMKHGFSKDQLEEALTLGGDIRFQRTEFRGGGRNPFNWVGRGMDAVDRFNFQLARSAALYATTYSNASKAVQGAGHKIGTPSWQKAMAGELSKQRGRVSREAWDAATLEALENVYREPLGPGAQSIARLKSQYPAMSYVVPFFNTVHNIFKQGYEATPISLAVKGSKALKQGSMEPFGKTVRGQEMMLAKGTVGTAAMMPLAYLAYSGQISGAGPTDPAERAQLYETGWRPNSILLPLPPEIATMLGATKSSTGRYWVNYSLLQPFSVPMSVMANAFDAYRNVQSRSEKSTKVRSATAAGAQFLQGVARSALSQSYLNGLGTLMEALQADDMSAELWLNNFARGWIPFSGMARNITRAIDPTLRQPRGLAESVAANVPGLSQTVAPRLTRWGEPTQLSGSALRRFAGIPEIEPQRQDPVDQELARLGLAVGRPSERIDLRGPSGERLKTEPAWGQQIRESRGKAHRAGMLMLMGSPAYQSAPDLIKTMMVRSVLASTSRDASGAAEAAIRLGKPELARTFLAPYYERAAQGAQ